MESLDWELPLEGQRSPVVEVGMELWAANPFFSRQDVRFGDVISKKDIEFLPRAACFFRDTFTNQTAAGFVKLLASIVLEH